MAANSSWTVDYSEVFYHSIYAIEGMFMLTTNVLILAIIAHYQALRERKEYVLIWAMALMDAISGLATLHTALYRLPLLLSSQHPGTTSRRFCFFACGLAFSGNLSFPGQGAMMLIIAADRLAITINPLGHMVLRRSYSFGMSALAYVPCGIFWVILFIRVWPYDQSDVTALCYSSVGRAPGDFMYVYYVFVILSTASVVVYLAVIVAYRKRQLLVSDGLTANAACDDFQRRLTKSLGFCCLTTFLLSVAPNLIDLAIQHGYIPLDEDLALKLSGWFFIAMNLNPVLNIFIYYKTQQEIKVGLKALFKNKEMPSVLDNWNLSATG